MDDAAATHSVEPHIVVRPTVRVLLLDELDRTLLFAGLVPDGTVWFPPGGGVEAGESLEEAARRELYEETGLLGIELGPHLWTRRHVIWFNGAETELQETWFVARVEAFEIDTSRFTELERATIRDHRWWTLPELTATSEVLAPRALAQLMADLLRDGPPNVPLSIGL